MKRLYRSRSTRVLGGVAAGMGEYFGVDVTAMRLIFALAGLILPQAILAYILAWVIIPEEPAGYQARGTKPAPDGPVAWEPSPGSGPEVVGPSGGLTADEISTGSSYDLPADTAPGRTGENPDRNRQFFGFALIGIGAVILLRRLIPSFWWRFPLRLVNEWWPLGIILIGVAMILGVIRGGSRH